MSDIEIDPFGNCYISKSEPLYACIDYCVKSETKNRWAIPDLQRDFVWTPSQMLLLLDSLFKGWPFGTLTLLKIDKKRPLRIAFRGLIQHTIRHLMPKYGYIDAKNDYFSLSSFEDLDADNALFLILDGQQRLQSLSMALGDDTSSFTSWEDDWMWEMEVGSRKIRNRDFEMCPPAYVFLDPEALASSYAKNNSLLTQIDYFNDNVIVWGISKTKTEFYSPYYDRCKLQQALQRKLDDNGDTRLIRLSKIWKFAGDCTNIDETNMVQQLSNWNIPVEETSELLPSLVAFVKRLTQLRNTPISRLELLPPDKSVSDDQYSNIIVNIFTRLNKGGTTLTPEDITFAWLKRGWNEAYAKADAKTCFYSLKNRCDGNHQYFAVNELIIMASYVWAIAGEGKIIRNDDLMNSQLLQELTKWLSSSWQTFADTTASVAEVLNQHGIYYHQQFNSIGVFAVWVASKMVVSQGSNAIASHQESAEYAGKTSGFMDKILERFFICSQWSGYWNNRLDTFVGKINADEIRQLDSVKRGYALTELLKEAMNNMSEIACRRIDEVNADNRSQVVRYHPFLWVWHRLNHARLNVWKPFMNGMTHVDHSLAFAFWLRLLGKEADKMTKPEYDEAERFINSLGNCILLKSEYNCSKSDKPFRDFFWWLKPEDEAEAKLLLQPCMTAPQSIQGDKVQTIKTAMRTREQKIREELKLFARGEEGYSLHN